MKNYIENPSRWEGLENKKNPAFTLAEVLITLAIIGVVAAITIPTVMNNAKDEILKTQFKKSYNVLMNATNKVRFELGGSVDCFYWVNPPNYCKAVLNSDGSGYTQGTTSINGNDGCREWNNPNVLPKDYNGIFSGCEQFRAAMLKTLKTTKVCEKKAVDGGCIPKDTYKTYAQVFQLSATDENGGQYTAEDAEKIVSANAFRTINDKTAYMLADGTLILDNINNMTIILVDINGLKKPNKWGYDVFPFLLQGTGNGYVKYSTYNMMVEPGGRTTTMMLKKALGNKK